jgi:hypothetical protein
LNQTQLRHSILDGIKPTEAKISHKSLVSVHGSLSAGFADLFVMVALLQLCAKKHCPSPIPGGKRFP